jgi:hypothetical protein
MAFSFVDITAGIHDDKILRWTVWFQTPFGLYGDLTIAVKQCQKNDIDPDLGIQPVPVALLNEDGTVYEIFRR